MIRGAGFEARVPAGWTVERPPRTVAAANPDGREAVSVGSFHLPKPFKPALWRQATPELNDVAARLAERVAASSRVVASRDGKVGTRRARVYEIRYTRDRDPLLDRVAFVFAGRREYQLTCRIRVDAPDIGRDACDRLLESFRVR